MTINQSKYLILYADDDPDDRMLLTEALSRYAADVSVVTFSDGAEAVAYLRNLDHESSVPCLIILDINMPKLSGRDTLAAIRNIQRFQDTPVVLFSTSSLPLDKAFAACHNAGFVTKPANVQETLVIADRFFAHCTDEVKIKLNRNYSGNNI